MDSFLLFFEDMPNWQKLLWIFICLTISWIVEGIYPFAKHQFSKWKHDAKNLVFLGMSLIINVIFVMVTVGIFQWLSQNEFGLLHLIHLPVWIELLIAILILDLVAQYGVHFLLHRIKWMWKLHMVHHSDTKLDASSGTRHHPGDYFLREVFALGAIVITGLPIAFYVFYRIVTVFFAYFTHINYSLPRWLDKTISYIFISPNMHKFHHHFERPWTDSNYGNIFSFWDRIFGTFVYDDPKKIRYGLDVLNDDLDEDIKYQLGIPFNKEIKTDY